MDPKTLEALKNSIEHHKKLKNERRLKLNDYELMYCNDQFEMNNKLNQKENRLKHYYGVRSCSLCQLFYRQKCKDCPIKEKTGKEYCSGTPYYVNDDNSTCLEDIRVDSNISDVEFEKYAQLEIDFLESLLPKE